MHLLLSIGFSKCAEVWVVIMSGDGMWNKTGFSVHLPFCRTCEGAHSEYLLLGSEVELTIAYVLLCAYTLLRQKWEIAPCVY